MSEPTETIGFEDQTESPTEGRVPQAVFALQLGGRLHMIEHGMVGAVTKRTERNLGQSELCYLDVLLKSGQTLQFGPITAREAEVSIAMCFGHPIGEDEVDAPVPSDYSEAAS